MPRKTRDERARRFAKNRKHRNQYPHPSVWGSGPFAERALDRWFAKRNGCDLTACETCALDARLSRMRSMYARRRGR